MTFDEFTSEIRDDLSKFDSAGLIDEPTIIKEVYRGLNKFGKFSLLKHTEVLDVSNNRVRLPDNFKKMYLAIKCEPIAYEPPKDIKIDQKFWKEIEKHGESWDECNPCDVNDVWYTKECIVETLYYSPNKPVKFYYNQPTFLKVVNKNKLSTCTENCPNLRVEESPYEVNIKNNVMYTNFKEGLIYIEYYGYPVDEEGLPIIPNSELGALEEYLENRVKLKIAEKIFDNTDDVPGDRIGTMIQRYEFKDRDLYLRAMTELKMENIFQEMDEYSNFIKKTFSFQNFKI